MERAAAAPGGPPVAPPAARGNFSDNCELYPKKRVVLVAVNMEYLDMFKNWLQFARPHLKSTEQLRVCAMDEDVVAPLEMLQAAEAKADIPLHFDVVAPPQKAALYQAPFDTEEYGRVVWQRVPNILNLLTAGCSVLYVDIDTVWVRDPFLDIESAGPSNLVLTNDNDRPDEPNFCSCFIYVSPAPETKELITRWGAKKTGNQDQLVFNAELRNMTDLQKAILPFDKFPPGAWAPGHRNATVFHANDIKGIETKIVFFKWLKLWRM